MHPAIAQVLASRGILTEEMQFESFKVNRKIDAGTFDPSK
jgi:hypothetical protein